MKNGIAYDCGQRYITSAQNYYLKDSKECHKKEDDFPQDEDE